MRPRNIQLNLFRNCAKCQGEKPFTEFWSQFGYCKPCAAEYTKTVYYTKHRTKIQEKLTSYRKSNPERVKKIDKLSRSKISSRIKANLRKSIEKHTKFKSNIGFTIKELQAYLETKFHSGMSWENYGLLWAIYKIKPIHEFDLTSESEVLKINHYLNLEPRILSKRLSEV